VKPELEAQEWMVAGACRGRDPELWFAEKGDRESTRIAMATCRSCPALKPCRTYALAHEVPAGIWGGLTALERERALKGRAA
jgi:WhiB family redox-sensing transcriptional regulator